MKKFSIGILCFALCLFIGGASAQKKGHLLIIGGGKKPSDALEKFVALSGNGPILVITSASGEPEKEGPSVVKQLINAGAKNIRWLHIDRPEIANTDSVVKLIEAASAIFFTGGVQERLMQRIGGTRSEAAIKKIYFELGGVIGGTSAGAAVMSEVMITGNELINKDTTDAFTTIQANNIETKRGFGFLDKVIIDQHFAARKRHNRLISLVLEHPNLVGIGIDEDTAILVQPNGKFKVYGKGSVIVYDARKAKSIQVNKDGLLSGRNLKMAVLVDGDEFVINTKSRKTNLK
ncbi:MAG: cyanophycinase [candidate division KSB1 bacterium]|nr:cyanophycinase [candidate division KSB1 bacterium]MDZ7336372.1 cyanophycinase [candidate division KSB1 bacterium]MDZ7401985.1 cyanophycinase [candidate division KSB1 bacterium]